MCSTAQDAAMMGGMGMMGPGMMIGGLLVLLVLLAGVVAGAVWLIRGLGHRDTAGGAVQTPHSAAQEELRRRYAAGEIDREEYLQRKVDLE
ncbi:SHOCT domain-containing protein [Lipingzhangella sp. LS1_29]|uniref:SHOCT domain-containing protein n=1 Tax=Lipingzhangella rawalii TaxID=2055835 RepID=A0ABU2H7N8_9ACTN|nr:SHOCT domain-containing protein [Lipingzhangella rawalii]MDS1270870.1 SHOCT domain-containing protein [Lipingzhangella rawalii]